MNTSPEDQNSKWSSIALFIILVAIMLVVLLLEKGLSYFGL